MKSRIIWVLIGFTLLVLFAHEKSNTEIYQGQNIKKNQRYDRWYSSLPIIELKVRQGLFEDDLLNRAGWPLQKIDNRAKENLRKENGLSDSFVPQPGKNIKVRKYKAPN